MVYIWYLKIKMEQKYNKMKEFITLKECSLLTQFDSFDNLNNNLKLSGLSCLFSIVL